MHFSNQSQALRGARFASFLKKKMIVSLASYKKESMGPTLAGWLLACVASGCGMGAGGVKQKKQEEKREEEREEEK